MVVGFILDVDSYLDASESEFFEGMNQFLIDFLDSEMMLNGRLTLEKPKLFRLFFGFCPQA
jgi:hypothetical protein